MRRITTCATLLFAVLALTTTSAADEKKKSPFNADVRAFLQNADKFELLSLDPNAPRDEDKPYYRKEWRLLGVAEVKSAKTRAALITALKKAHEEHDGIGYFCFIPRHAIRATTGNKVVEIVICFECRQTHTYTTVGDKTESDEFLISGSAQPVFDKVLTDAKVPLPKPPKKDD